MGARHLMSGWADTSAVIARCFPARGGEAISTMAQRLTGAEEPQEGGGATVQEVPRRAGGGMLRSREEMATGKEKSSHLNCTPWQQRPGD